MELEGRKLEERILRDNILSLLTEFVNKGYNRDVLEKVFRHDALEQHCQKLYGGAYIQGRSDVYFEMESERDGF
jgi:hypothetical protein